MTYNMVISFHDIATCHLESRIYLESTVRRSNLLLWSHVHVVLGMMIILRVHRSSCLPRESILVLIILRIGNVTSRAINCNTRGVLLSYSPLKDPNTALSITFVSSWAYLCHSSNLNRVLVRELTHFIGSFLQIQIFYWLSVHSTECSRLGLFTLNSSFFNCTSKVLVNRRLLFGRALWAMYNLLRNFGLILELLWGIILA